MTIGQEPQLNFAHDFPGWVIVVAVCDRRSAESNGLWTRNAYLVEDRIKCAPWSTEPSKLAEDDKSSVLPTWLFAIITRNHAWTAQLPIFAQSSANTEVPLRGLLKC